uniref:Uncharacterized protein n=1 Tax=Nelumbo nucifera TaxID=4432 RepID=A0A822ZGY0_NELNU|nr:TPA_asm: hypothetical protein HUJ06_002103 [Nelumbo nucifera]
MLIFFYFNLFWVIEYLFVFVIAPVSNSIWAPLLDSGSLALFFFLIQVLCKLGFGVTIKTKHFKNHHLHFLAQMASEPVFRQLDRHLSIHTPAFKWQITFLSRRHHLVSKTPVNSTSLIQELAMALLSLRLRGSLFLSSSLFSHRRLSRPDMTIFEGCYYNHWLITMELPNDSKPTPEVMAETYVQAPAKVIGRYVSLSLLFWCLVV